MSKEPTPKCILATPNEREDLAEQAPAAHQFAVVDDDRAIRSIELRQEAIIVQPVVRGDSLAETVADARVRKLADSINLPIMLE